MPGVGALDVPLGQEANRQSEEEDKEEGYHVVWFFIRDGSNIPKLASAWMEPVGACLHATVATKVAPTKTKQKRNC